jgi:hypothetical protein
MLSSRLSLPLIAACVLTIVLVPHRPVWAAEESPAKADSVPQVAESAYSPTDLERLRSLKTKTVIIEGQIAALGENQTRSMRYLNFTKDYSQSVSLVFFVSKDPEKYSHEALSAYVGKRVRVVGPISEHKGNLQIVIDSLDRVQIVSEGAAPAKP